MRTKIALVVPGGVDRSGEVRVVPALLALLKRLSVQHEVHVFAFRQEPAAAQWMLHGAHIHNIGTQGVLPIWLRCLLEIRREHRRGRFALIHAIWSGSGGWVSVLAGCLLGLPSLVHVAGGELAALPCIGYGGLLSWRGRLKEAWVLRRATVVTAASEPVLAQIALHGRQALRVPLGVDLREWPVQRPIRREARSQLRLIHVASLNLVKDQFTLLQALRILMARGVDFRLDVVGEDTLHGTIQAQARQLGLAGHVDFHGFMTQAQLWPLMARAHVSVISSQHETGPLVVLEAAVLGVPSVGTAVGHLAEWTSQSPRAALAVKVGDGFALFKAIAQLNEDEELRLQLAAAAQRCALHEDADRTAALFESLYRQVSES